jgi:hypothetical protein
MKSLSMLLAATLCAALAFGSVACSGGQGGGCGAPAEDPSQGQSGQ